MYFIYLQKLLRRGRMIIQCLQLTEALENPQKTSSAFGLGGFLRIFHASARCKHRIIPHLTIHSLANVTLIILTRLFTSLYFHTLVTNTQIVHYFLNH